METVERYKKGNQLFTIYVDPDPVNPRTEYDNLGTLAHWHPRYILGEEQIECDPKEWFGSLPKGTIALPVYLMDHSGLSLSISSFGCPWDSGQVGWIYITPEKLKSEGVSEEQARKTLECEIEIYSDYLRGCVYGFVLSELKPCETCGHTEDEHIDSCWGFIGCDLSANGIYDEMPGGFDSWGDCEEGE